MRTVHEKLAEVQSISSDPLCERLVWLLTRPTGMTSAGYPYFERRTFECFRDKIPYLFGMGQRILDAQKVVARAVQEEDATDEERTNVERACRVARQIVQTAAITAPTDLWLLRHIISIHSGLGITDRLLSGEAIHPEFCEVQIDGETHLLDAEQLAIDLDFLLSRGMVEQYDESFRIAGHERVHRLFSELGTIEEDEAVPATPLWKKCFEGESLTREQEEALIALGDQAPKRRQELKQNHWIPTPDEVRTGYLLVPLVLGLRAADLSSKMSAGGRWDATMLSEQSPAAASAGLAILESAGWVDDDLEVTELGQRGLARGPGPFGIIQTYVSYMKMGRQILMQGRKKVWVRRGENIGASQDANRRTFQRANDSLDQFCEDTGFEYNVFIEHAIGRGEATRQRFERSGEEEIRYFGADLEDAAIDAAEAEQRAGRLPSNMVFIRRADIGKPQKLIAAIEDHEGAPKGAVMLVGNGFHEVRDQTDEKMAEVFRGYHEAGILLLFTEENALSVDDLRATAYNTYHAGFKYVHEKSGQCLRPASPRPRPRLGPPLRAAWSECASEAGYVRLDQYCARTRTIYPYPRPNGHNPSISVNHFFVPQSVAERFDL